MTRTYWFQHNELNRPPKKNGIIHFRVTSQYVLSLFYIIILYYIRQKTGLRVVHWHKIIIMCVMIIICIQSRASVCSNHVRCIVHFNLSSILWSHEKKTKKKKIKNCAGATEYISIIYLCDHFSTYVGRAVTLGLDRKCYPEIFIHYIVLY